MKKSIIIFLLKYKPLFNLHEQFFREKKEHLSIRIHKQYQKLKIPSLNILKQSVNSKYRQGRKVQVHHFIDFIDQCEKTSDYKSQTNTKNTSQIIKNLKLPKYQPDQIVKTYLLNSNSFSEKILQVNCIIFKKKFGESMSALKHVDQEITQIYDQFKPILTEYKIIKNLSPSIQPDLINPEFSNAILRSITNLHAFLINLTDKNINDQDQQEFLINYNDLIVEIVSSIGEIINTISDQLFKLKETKIIVSNYAALVLNLAEKSPIKYNHLRNIFNKLVGNLLNLILTVQNHLCNSFISQCANEQCLVYELHRAIGSLVYENGPVLNNQNIDSIISCATKLESQIEEKIEFLAEKKWSSKNQGQEDVLYKLKLISTQLVFNITMAKINKNKDNDQGEKEFIGDQHKVPCAEFFIKVLRFNVSLKFNLPFGGKNEDNREKQMFEDEEFMVNVTKTMNKALHGLENLFLSINASLNWIHIKNEKFQLGDILAIVKSHLNFQKGLVSLWLNDKKQ
ncbi:hypothetical protein BpHYR1_029759 [Brachionus plicatilis]|uniref:Uncharacterized protein n=1 Tax=Brachionus plicatilis TaxID=10195 RepID=A0A3M7PVX5_BRAPC|nr:hypothetical protein BpHYR1_029759 [Brachionus plicatilis]